MKKNVSGQKVGAQLVSATDGSAFTGSVTVSVTIDAGTQATGTVGSGACTHEGNGYHTYAPSQAETNGDLVAFTFTGTGAVPVTVQVYTRPTTGLLAPTVADRTLDVTATGAAGIDWANVENQSTSVSLSATTVATVTTTTTATNVTTVDGLAANVITAAATAADFGTEVGTAVWATAARTLTAATNITSTGVRVPITAGGLVSADVTAISTDTTAANNCEAFFDGTGYAGTNNVIPTVTNVTTVNGLAAGVITTASIADNAITTGKIDVTAYDTMASTVWEDSVALHTTPGTFGGNFAIITSIDGKVDTIGTVVDAIKVKTDYLPSATAGAAGGVFIAGSNAATTVNFTGNLTGNVTGTIGGLSAAALADFFDTNSGTTYASAVAGSVVKEIADNAGDPWTTTLPGTYTGTEAGAILGTLRSSTMTVSHPVPSEDNTIELVIGDDYYAADSRNLSFSYGATPSLSGATVKFKIQLEENDTGYSSTNTSTTTTGSVSGTNPQVVTFDIPGTTTDDLSEGWHDYEVEATLSNGHVVTLTRGRVEMLSQVV